MNQFESIQRQLAEIQEQLDQCATKEDIKEFNTVKVSVTPLTGMNDGEYIEVLARDANRMRKLINDASQQKFNAASLNINLGGEAHNICKLTERLRVIIDKALNGDLDAAIKNERAAREAADEKLAKSIQDADQNMLQFSARECRKAFKAKQLNDSIRVVGEAVRQGKITLNQARELLNLPAVKDGDYYVAQDEKERVVSDEMNKALADIILKQGQENLKQIQELEFKTVEQRKYDAVIADVTRSLRYDYHILITFIDVQKMVDFFIDKGVRRGELDPYLYAAKESVKFIENLNK